MCGCFLEHFDRERKPLHHGLMTIGAVIPGRCEASNPESRDSGSGPSDHPGMTVLRQRRAITQGEPAGPQAAAFFSSRSSRRRILPTLVLGRSVLNSICLGTL